MILPPLVFPGQVFYFCAIGKQPTDNITFVYYYCHIIQWWFQFSLSTPYLVNYNFVNLLFGQWGSVTHQMAVPVPTIRCCALNHHNLFYQIQNALAFNQDTCCHLVLCLRLLPFHYLFINFMFVKLPCCQFGQQKFKQPYFYQQYFNILLISILPFHQLHVFQRKFHQIVVCSATTSSTYTLINYNFVNILFPVYNHVAISFTESPDSTFFSSSKLVDN